MSWCTLNLSIKDGSRALHAGDVIEGDVEVQLDRAGRCDGLRVELLVRALGKGNTSERVLERAQLFVGDWAPGTTLRYPFQITVPPAPPPMEGGLMTVTHVLRAVADVPWAIDPKDEQPLTLAPSPAWRSNAARMSPYAAHSDGRKIGKMWLPGVFIFIFLFFTCAPVAVLLVPLALLLFFPRSRNTIAAWRTPMAAVTVPRRVAPGQTVPVVIELDRLGPPVKAVSATLICVERAISGSGKHQRTTEHTLYEDALVLSAKGKPTRFEGQGVMPDLPLWSFEGGSYSVAWMMIVRLECSAWPDWITAWPLSVDPAEAPALAAPPAAKLPTKIPERLPAPEPIVAPPPIAAPPPAPVPAPPPDDEAQLAALSRALKAASPLNDERAALLHGAATTPLTFTLRAERVERSFGLHLPEGHRDGRTATGALADGTPVSVSLRDADTAAAEGRPRGTPLRITATVTGWNTLYDRVELVGALV
jgi:hypothetical protein